MNRLDAMTTASLGLLLAATACAKPEREPPPAGDPAQIAERDGVRQDSRFSGFVRLQTAGAIDSVRVALINLDLHGSTTVDSVALPFEGTMMAYVEAGTAVSTVGGVEQERNQGQIWTVPAGAALRLATRRDAASIQLVLVERGK
jgi:mannose-6-phosphate isomerase-like protein (cupin superfamily)